MGNRTCWHPLRTSRQNSAKNLALEREKRSPQQQLALLDSRPGNSTRERARLRKMIAGE